MKKVGRRDAVRWLVAFVALGAAAMMGAVYQGAGAHAFAPSAVQPISIGSDPPVVTLYRNPSCGCCGEWAEHLRENGFEVEMKEAESGLADLRAGYGIPRDIASCHTALVDEYILEGHVPARFVKQLLRKRPEIWGLAVPGMPAGVPGMPAAGPDRDPYEVIAVQHDGSTFVYATV